MKLFPGLRHGTLLCLAAIVLTAVADAQPPGGGRGGQRGERGGQRGERGGQQGRRGFGGGFQGGRGGGGGVTINRATLLGSSQVREELKIDAGQGATLDAAIESYRDERREGSRIDFQSLRDMDEAERTAVLEKARVDREALTKKTDEVLAALLEPGQVERLDQIAMQIQLQGDVAAALQSDDMKKKLGVTEEQVATLKSVQEEISERQQEMRDRMREAFQNGGGGGGGGADFEAMRAEGEKMRTLATEKAMAVLTADQMKKLNELKGSPFELDMRQLFGGGRGGGGFGGGPPGGGRGFGGGQPGGGRGFGGGEGGGRGRGGNRGGNRPPADDDDPTAI